MSTTSRRDRPDPMKGNGGEMQHPKKDCAKCAMLTMESADKALMPTSVAVRADTWLRNSYKKRSSWR